MLTNRILRLTAVSGLLLGSLLLSLPAKAATCTQCDENYYNCRISGNDLNACSNTYDHCLAFCSLSGGGGSGGGGVRGCGRTPCDSACNQTRLECIANGGENCGAEYQACALSCC